MMTIPMDLELTLTLIFKKVSKFFTLMDVKAIISSF